MATSVAAIWIVTALGLYAINLGVNRLFNVSVNKGYMAVGCALLIPGLIVPLFAKSNA